MQDTWGFAHFLENTDGVARLLLGALACASVISWTLIVQGTVRHLRHHRGNQHFVRAFWQWRDPVAARSAMQGHASQDAFAELARAALAATAAEAPLTRTLQRTITRLRQQHDAGQTWLATVASSAPFIGLLGTVWGIYHALIAIGAAGQSTLDKVAGPVGEALIMTAIGLAVAIPAAMAYNAFARNSRLAMAQLTAFADDLEHWLTAGSPPLENQSTAALRGQ